MHSLFAQLNETENGFECILWKGKVVGVGMTQLTFITDVCVCVHAWERACTHARAHTYAQMCRISGLELNAGYSFDKI